MDGKEETIEGSLRPEDITKLDSLKGELARLEAEIASKAVLLAEGNIDLDVLPDDFRVTDIDLACVFLALGIQHKDIVEIQPRKYAMLFNGGDTQIRKICTLRRQGKPVAVADVFAVFEARRKFLSIVRTIQQQQSI